MPPLKSYVLVIHLGVPNPEKSPTSGSASRHMELEVPWILKRTGQSVSQKRQWKTHGETSSGEVTISESATRESLALYKAFNYKDMIVILK